MSARPDMISVSTVKYSVLIYYSVNLRSDVYFFRHVAIAVFFVFLFLHSQPSVFLLSIDSDFRLLCVRLAVHVYSHLSFGREAPACCRATLKSGIRNRKESKNHNPESTNQRKQVFHRRGKLLCKLLPQKIRELSVEICATIISSEGYDYENLKACLHGGRVPWLTGLPG